MTARRPRRTRANLDHPTMRRLLGGVVLDRLGDADPARAPLVVGAQVWSTHRLATELGVVNTRAARLLSAAAASIGATSVRDLYARATPYTLAGVDGLGETTLYVLWRLFESQGLDPERWALAGSTADALVSFHALKVREQKAAARTKADARAARRRERSASHERAVAASLSTAKG